MERVEKLFSWKVEKLEDLPKDTVGLRDVGSDGEEDDASAPLVRDVAIFGITFKFDSHVELQEALSGIDTQVNDADYAVVMSCDECEQRRNIGAINKRRVGASGMRATNMVVAKR